MASGIPNLQFDFVAIEWKGLESKVNADGCQKDLAKLIISISHNYRRLANARVAYKNNLEEIVVFALTLEHLEQLLLDLVIQDWASGTVNSKRSLIIISKGFFRTPTIDELQFLCFYLLILKNISEILKV